MEPTFTEGEELLDTSLTYLLPITRHQLLMFLPRGGAVAEIGVAEGGYSDVIFNINQPSRYDLIDLWAYQEDAEYDLDPYNSPDKVHNERMEKVRNHFAKWIDAGRVFLHRGYSHEVAKKFAPHTFDWIYIDANHTYSAVKLDLESYRQTVKPTGFIAGHDFANQGVAERCAFGVVPAVQEFCREHGHHILAITSIEEFPTYIIALDKEGDFAKTFVRTISYAVSGMVAVRNFLDRDFQMTGFRFTDNRINQFITI